MMPKIDPELLEAIRLDREITEARDLYLKLRAKKQQLITFGKWPLQETPEPRTDKPKAPVIVLSKKQYERANETVFVYLTPDADPLIMKRIEAEAFAKGEDMTGVKIVLADPNKLGPNKKKKPAKRKRK